MTGLFTPLQIRSVEFKNRIFVSPMCQYSAHNGLVNEWHFTHAATRAVGGSALFIVEATSVSAEGRISRGDAGIWDDMHITPMRTLADTITKNGAIAGIQLAHAGRKASCTRPGKVVTSSNSTKVDGKLSGLVLFLLIQMIRLQKKFLSVILIQLLMIL